MEIDHTNKNINICDTKGEEKRIRFQNGYGSGVAMLLVGDLNGGRGHEAISQHQVKRSTGQTLTPNPSVFCPLVSTNKHKRASSQAFHQANMLERERRNKSKSKSPLPF